MVSAGQIAEIIDGFAPFDSAEDFDNVGLLYESGRETSGILFALDITAETVNEAVFRNCGILVSHHPAMLGGITRLRFDDAVARAVKNDVSLIAAHTNLDRARGGINDVLAGLLGLSVSGVFCEDIGRIGVLKEAMSPEDFAGYVKARLGCKAVFAVLGEHAVKTVAVGGGSYDFVRPAQDAGADALLTGELKHHQALEAKSLGLTAVAAGHFATENRGIFALRQHVEKQLRGKAECFDSDRGTDPLSVI